MSREDFTHAGKSEVVNFVIRFIEVMGDQGIFMCTNAIDMFINSDTEFTFCFADIQFVTFSADNCIDNITGFACQLASEGV